MATDDSDEAAAAAAPRVVPDSWPMRDSPDLGVYVSRQLWSGQEPLLGIRHFEGGDWGFWGKTDPADHEDDEGALLYVHLKHVVERFPEVADFAGLAEGRCVVRSEPSALFIEGD